MALPELAEALVAARGTALEEPGDRRRLASALVRVGVRDRAGDGRAPAPPAAVRPGRCCWPARPSWPNTPSGWARWPTRWRPRTRCRPPLRVFQRLYEVAQPEFPPDCQPPNNERMLRLAAAASDHAAVSSRQELYPRGHARPPGLAARPGGVVRAGGWATRDRKGERFDARSIRERIAARYPEAEPLPDRPGLDGLLREVGLDVAWDETTSTFHRPDERREATSGSTRPHRLSTHTGSRRPARDVSPRWPRPASSRSGCGTRSATARSWC